MKEFSWKVAAYEYSDLSEEARETVNEWYLEGQDSDTFTDMVRTDLNMIFPNSDLEVQYSLGYYQGDGLNIYGRLATKDMIALLKDEFTAKELKTLEWVSGWISEWELPRNQMDAYCICGMYDYAEDVLWELENAYLRNLPIKLIQKFCNKISEYLVDYCRRWEKEGYRYFYEVDDAIVEDWCCANEYWFGKSGNIIASGDEELQRFVVREIGTAICDFIYENRR